MRFLPRDPSRNAFGGATFKKLCLNAVSECRMSYDLSSLELTTSSADVSLVMGFARIIGTINTTEFKLIADG